jgi:hypothetical protein
MRGIHDRGCLFFTFLEEPMLVFDWIEARVYLIPGGDPDSLVAYTGIETLLKEHEDLWLTAYRGPHPR